jgi:tRNA(fMet)-specific endonuclease VapC
MNRFMLDTNMVSHFVRQNAMVIQRIVATPIDMLCISSITEGELLFGLAHRPVQARLKTSISEMLARLDILPWDSSVAPFYADLRAKLHKTGRLLGSLDMLIAAHALSLNATLVTNDRDFDRVVGLTTEDWTQPTAP